MQFAQLPYEYFSIGMQIIRGKSVSLKKKIYSRLTRKRIDLILYDRTLHTLAIVSSASRYWTCHYRHVRRWLRLRKFTSREEWPSRDSRGAAINVKDSAISALRRRLCR